MAAPPRRVHGGGRRVDSVIVLGHVSGAPLEELIPLACGGALLWPALRAFAGSATRRIRGPA